MYTELDKYLSGFFTEDSWYDDGFEIAREMLEEFNDNDWEKLLSDILLKSVEWQIRFAYCVDSNINDENIIKCLIILSNLDNEALFEGCIDSLRCIVNSENIESISKDKILIEKVKKLLPMCGDVTRKIFEDFLIKLKDKII
ncbi:hypothetical protein NNC19_22895 [Clostridium sp. SHJSY1]|uniref:hypothetical protein n=1 Tax=Clostridium sp. SHJSY1 TaxID=2942483 RepID=UPI002876E760|nr:hypothetical protein [Clostridium sp. SHJSY1]MDS0528529.1 hypothetical protein [Clostridium sp. SHJSY1]